MQKDEETWFDFRGNRAFSMLALKALKLDVEMVMQSAKKIVRTDKIVGSPEELLS
jgi:hypothetical protein